MTKLRLYSLFLLTLAFKQTTAQYSLKIIPVDKDTSFLNKTFSWQTVFKDRNACLDYIAGIPVLLKAKGYITASMDSVRSDSSKAEIHLYTGDVFKWAHIRTKKDDRPWLEASGWNSRNYEGKTLNYQQLQSWQTRLLGYMENNGYPFAKIFIDSILIREGELSGALKVDKGPLYHIDSIRVFGSAKISPQFMQHYLNLPEGSIYKKDKLEAIDKQIQEISFLKEENPWKLTLLGTGSVLDLYLKQRKSNQIDALIGFLPSTTTNGTNTSSKLLVTGQATINLKNPFGNGESIGLDWQQIQPGTPKLDINFQQPYLFNSPFGLTTDFNLLKQDSTYININFMIGATYSNSIFQTTTVFLKLASSNLLTLDTTQIISTHELPPVIDYSSIAIGLTYQFNNTNYKFNPRRGNEFSFTGTIGTKTIKQNNVINQLIDPNDSSFNFTTLYDSIKLNSYEVRLNLSGAHYFQLGRTTTLKLGFNGGLYQSPNNFLNELFLIGGYRLLRGFDEQSIYATQYAVGTLEYRYLIGMNSFLFTFLDYGWAKNNVPDFTSNSTYMGIGLGMAFETKAGIFNISYALGRQDDNAFSFKEAKIHLGYVNFF